MSASIERRLSRTLALVVSLAALASALVSFVVAYDNAEEFQDDTLRQVAILAAMRTGDGRIGAGFARESGADPASRLIVADEHGPLPDWIPKDLDAGFHTVAHGAERMRVFVADNPGGRIMVAQPTDLRDQMAFDSALQTLVPLFMMLPLLVIVTGFIVRGELMRVRRLAESVDRSSPHRLEMLPASKVPAEVGLFIAAINRLIVRINRLMEEHRRFIADAAHELRSPLTALGLQAQNVENADSPAARRERMAALKKGIHRAHRLAEQLLKLAKAQAAGPEGRIDVPGLARELIEEYQPLAQDRGIDLGLEQLDRLELLGAPDCLRLVLKNALDNALAYTPRNGEVTVRLSAGAADAIIEVLDSGPGIPAEERERVFAPFYRVRGTPGEGSGLGLAIARDAAIRLGGSIAIADRVPGPGLAFQYRQQRAQEPAPSRPSAAQADSAAAQVRILVVDDEHAMRELVRLHLRNAGYDVSVAEDAVQAGSLIMRDPPDLLIVDVFMPYMNGYEFVSALKRDPATRDIPVVFLTSAEDVEEQAARLGAAAYLRKPVKAAQLLETVRAFAP